jgi:hypothetical protein
MQYTYGPKKGTEKVNVQVKWNGNFEVEDKNVLQGT